MENFVLYHEIYKRDGLTMYKGRKKGTITYVAISCIDKGERIKVTNHVRLVYELEHRHIVKFYEWYETSNHLWLVTELCVGGTLAQILQQDVRLPEVAVRVFGCHLVRGMHYMHCNELIYADWHPEKIILSGDGSLKFFDFSDSRKVNEEQQDIFQRFFSTLNVEQSEIDELFACRAVCEYTAPELLHGGAPSPASDIWGLGCVLYEMFAGSPPFGGHEDPQQLTNSIMHTPLIVPRAHSASAHLNDLLQRLFVKDAASRISLADLCSHPFWNGGLDDIVGPCAAFVSVTPRTAHGPVSVADDSSTSTVDDISFTMHLGSRPTDVGTVEAPHPLTSEAPHSEHARLMSIAMASVAGGGGARAQSDEYAKMAKDGRLKYDSKLLAVVPYTLAKWRSLRRSDKDKHLKQLEVVFKTGEKGPPSQRRLHLINYLAQMSMAPEVSSHLMENGLAMDLCRQLKGNSNQELVSRVCQTLAIIFHHSNSPSNTQEVVTVFGEMATILSDLLRDQFRCSKIKLPCVSALGECLVKLAQSSGTDSPVAAVGLAINLINRCLHRTEEVTVSLAAARAIESVTQYPNSPITRQLANGETVQQLYTGYKHATIDVLKTSAITALVRLTRIEPALFAGLLDKIGPQTLLDNVHLALLTVQECVIEMFLLILLSPTSNSASVRKLTQDSAFLIASMRVLETTSPLVRAKSLLLVLLLCQADISLLRTATEHRLVLYIERELKRVPTGEYGRVPATNNEPRALTGEYGRVPASVSEPRDTASGHASASTNEHRAPAGSDASTVTESISEQTVALFITFLANTAVPTILQDCVSSLATVQGRKHPSSAQVKSLRRSLAQLESVSSIVSSSPLRAAVLSSPSSFCQSLATLLSHAHLVDSCQTSLGGPDTAPHFLSHTMALVEAACHSPDVLTLTSSLLPALATLTSAGSNADLRIIGLKLCADMIQMVDSDTDAVPLSVIREAVESRLLPQTRQFFVDPDPSAVYMLRLLRHYLSVSSDTCILACHTHAVPHLLVQLLIDHQTRVMNATVHELLLLVSAISLVSADLLRDLVLDVDLVPVMCEIVLEIGDHYHKEDDKCQQTARMVETFQTAMDTLYSLSRLISDVVRSALQSKKNGDNEQVTAKLTIEAEELLGAGKPLTETVDLLIFTVGNDGPDSDIGDTATRLLNQVVSLYGGQQIQHGVREANLRSLCVAITAATVKQRRTLLRILKRLLVSGRCSSVSAEAGLCVRQMVATMASDCDAASKVLVDDVARLISDKQ